MLPKICEPLESSTYRLLWPIDHDFAFSSRSIYAIFQGFKPQNTADVAIVNGHSEAVTEPPVSYKASILYECIYS